MESTLNLAGTLLNKNGAIVMVGLFGKEITIPLFQTVIKEYQLYGPLWGNFKHRIQKFRLSEVNDAIELLHGGNITGRAVIIP